MESCALQVLPEQWQDKFNLQQNSITMVVQYGFRLQDAPCSCGSPSALENAGQPFVSQVERMRRETGAPEADLLGRVKIKVGSSKVWRQQLNGLIIDLLLGEVHERVEEGAVTHHAHSLIIGSQEDHGTLHILPDDLLDRQKPAPGCNQSKLLP